jgi:hypothetical protein
MRVGHIFIAGCGTLGAYAAGRLIAGKLAAVSGLRVHQWGDTDVSVGLKPEVFPTVAERLQARRRSRDPAGTWFSIIMLE